MSGFAQNQPMPVRDAMQVVVDQLNAAGVPTVLDPADLAVPGAVVYPNLVDYDVLGHNCYDLTIDVVLVAGDLAAPAALDQLDELLRGVRSTFAIDTATAAGVRLPGQAPDPLPAFTARITVNVSPEEQE